MFVFFPHVLQQVPESTSYNLAYMEAIILGMLAAGMPAYFAMDHTRDREVSSPMASLASYLLPLVSSLLLVCPINSTLLLLHSF